MAYTAGTTKGPISKVALTVAYTPKGTPSDGADRLVTLLFPQENNEGRMVVPASLLSAVSPRFQKILNTQLDQPKVTEITVENLSPSAFLKFLEVAGGALPKTISSSSVISDVVGPAIFCENTNLVNICINSASYNPTLDMVVAVESADLRPNWNTSVIYKLAAEAWDNGSAAELENDGDYAHPNNVTILKLPKKMKTKLSCLSGPTLVKIYDRILTIARVTKRAEVLRDLKYGY